MVLKRKCLEGKQCNSGAKSFGQPPKIAGKTIQKKALKHDPCTVVRKSLTDQMCVIDLIKL